MPRRKKNHDTEKEKHLILVSGVTFFMVLILAIWSYNLQKVFSATKDEYANDSNMVDDLHDITKDFSDQIKEVKDVIGELKEEVGDIQADELAEVETGIEAKEEEGQFSGLPISEDLGGVGSSSVSVAGTSTQEVQ